jgi:site-specific recombinase XerD
MTQELRIRGMAERTVEAYVQDMRLLTERTGLLPGHVTEEDMKAYLDDLLVERHVAPSTYAQHVAAMRFFYTHLTDGSMGRVQEALSTMTGGL